MIGKAGLEFFDFGRINTLKAPIEPDGANKLMAIHWCVRNAIWATSWENLFYPYANNKGADQPMRPCSLISAFVVRCLDSKISLVSVCKISSLKLASEAKQTSLSLIWLKTPKTGFLVTWLICDSTDDHDRTPQNECWRDISSLTLTRIKLCSDLFTNKSVIIFHWR